MTYKITRPVTIDLRVRVVGHPTAPIGMGEHVRSVWRALREAGVDASIVDIYGPPPKVDPEFTADLAASSTHDLGQGVNIFCINGDEIAPALNHMRTRRPMSPGSHNVIYPAWELERYPSVWAQELERFDEVWSPSQFIREAITRAVSRPVLHMPLACEVRRRGLRSRRHFGIRDSAYAFLFAFDFLSYVERKNPFAVVEAFQELMAERPFDDIVLVIKTNNSAQRPAMADRFREAVASLQERVIVIDETLSELDMKSLIWLCDSFISLHRSEGFGRGMSEAMILGKPVIATAYSGNMDFCTPETAKLVAYDLIPLREGDYPHWENQHWADPDIESAVRGMRELVDDPAAGRALGRRARLHIAEHFGYLRIGQRYAQRVAAIEKDMPADDNVSTPRAGYGDDQPEWVAS